MEIPRGGGGGGWVSKRRQFPRESGVAYRGLFPGSLSKIGQLIINSSFSVEKAISYLLLPLFQNKYYC